MTGQHNLNAHFGRALYNSLEIFNLEPQQYAIPIGSVVTIGDAAVMMFDFEAVQLKHQLAV